ncbi:MDR family MFS transporter [Vibrio palustris]|uniref:Putative transporter n=1 Tax=Vibrio palustris TaxID=1918946 RepID=A0A1R4B5I0_9VIBR|nr:MFS transporter [Vibrio palustris]SJL84170.1 putative transporter [Vibrio palustris]
MDDNRLFLKARFARFTQSIWTVIFGTLLVRTTYFMAWPFLIVFLYRDYQASAVTIGGMLAFSAMLGCTAGFYIGYLSDLFGRRTIMLIGAALACVAYGGIGLADHIWLFYVLIAAAGLTRPMLEEVAKSVISDQLTNKKDRELALNLRYFTINLGGTLGPLIGITLGLSQPQSLFLFTGFSYILYGCALLMVLNKGKVHAQHDEAQLPHFAAAFAVISKDRLFMILLLANLLLMFVYAQVESSLPQVIVRSGLDGAAEIVSSLVLVNTITCILFQFPLLRLLEPLSLFMRAKIGIVLFLISQIGFVFTTKDWPQGWYVCSFLLSVGEVIVFPTLGVQLDRLAPEHLRGSYYGAMGLSGFGFAIAPLLGGLMIDMGGSSWLYSLCVLLCILVVALYHRAQRHDDVVARQMA